MKRVLLETFKNELFIETHHTFQPSLCSVNESDKFGSVCHGDLGWSNILFKYNTENCPKEVKFIDFQASRISSLVTDLLTFVFTSLSSSMRRDYIGHVMKVSRHSTSSRE